MRRRGKVETDDQTLNPLFPRMHVNDRDKGGGPKPPPRNKMALYNQPAGVTSHRIICGGSTPPAIPLLPPKYSAIATSAPSNYISGQEIRSRFALQINSPAAADRLPFYAQSAAAAAGAAATMNGPMPLLPFPMFDGQVTSSPSGSKNSLGKRPPGLSSGEEKRHDEKPKPDSELKIFQQIHFRDETNGSKGGRAGETYAQRYASNALLPINISTTVSSMEWHQMNQCSRKTQCVKSQLSEVLGSGSSTKPAANKGEQVVASELIRSETCPKAPPVDDIRGPDGLERVHKPRQDCEYGLPELHNVCKKKDDCRPWEISTTEFTSNNVHMRPEDAIGIIGEQEAFLKLRNDMIKHQKEFAEQVFELHRLIAVQRLMARSRRTSLEDRKKLEKPSSSRTPSNPKELQKGHNNVERQQDDSTRPKSWSECPKEMLYLPPPSKDSFKVPSSITPIANQETSARNPKPANDGGISPAHWIYPPPGTANNHWLVPVLSPSEGLIYKPYPIPSAPGPAGFMTPPMYGSCQPIHVNPPKAAQTHSASRQSGIRPFADIPPYFPPFVTPGPLTTSTSAFDPSAKAGSHQRPNIALADSSFKSSWNFSSLVSTTVSRNMDAIQQAKDGGAHQDSTARSSPPRRPPGNILPLFPVEPTAIAMQNKVQHRHQGQSSEQQRKVTEVVPGHPESAPDSSAPSIRPVVHEERE